MPRPARLLLTALEDRWTPAAGDLDLSYGTGGRFRLPAAPGDGTFVSTEITAITPLPDGGALVAGPATTYTAGTPGFPQAGGSAPQAGGSVARVVRLLPAGTPDPAFDADGVADIPEIARVTAVAVQPDGRVLVVGPTPDGSAGTYLARLTADGRRDLGFGSNGNGLVTLPGGIDRVSALAVRPDGRILLAGSNGPGVSFVPFSPTDLVRTFAVAQLTADGRPDAGFAGDGVAEVEFPANGLNSAGATAVAVQPDGRVVLAGEAVVDVRTTTTTGGRVPTTSRTITTRAAVARLTADGAPDAGFGDGGRVRLDAPTTGGFAEAVAVRPDGGLLLAGASGAARLTPAGRPDPGYAGDGVAEGPGGLGDALVQADGGVLISNRVNLFRLTPAGEADPAFGAGRTPLPFLRNDAAAYPSVSLGETAQLADGRLLVAAATFADPFTPTGSAVYRLQGTAPGAAAAGDALRLSGTRDGAVRLVAAVDGQFAEVGSLLPYPNFGGTARTAAADVTGDGVPDTVVGPGPGGGPNVVVVDGATGATVADLDAFELTFRGGVFVAAADLTGDGKAEVVVTPDQGGGPVVVVYDGARLAAGQNEAAQLARFFGIVDPDFRGGARPALGDVSGDGVPDLLVAAGFGGGPRVAVFDGTGVINPARYTQEPFGPRTGRASSIQPTTAVPPKLLGDFFVFEETLRNGVFVSAGDLTADGAAEVVVGGGPGGGPRVLALDGRALLAGTQTPVANFFAGDSTSRGGVRVAVRPDAGGQPQLVTGSGGGEAATVRVYRPATARTGGGPDQTVQPFGGAVLEDGVFVG